MHPQLNRVAVAPVTNETLSYNAAAILRNKLTEVFTTDGSLKLKLPSFNTPGISKSNVPIATSAANEIIRNNCPFLATVIFIAVLFFMKNITCGGASRAILRANLRIQLQSRTEVHSFSFALIYPQPCRTIHPPVASKPFWTQLHWWRGACACAFCSRKTKSDKILFSSAEKIWKTSVSWFYEITMKKTVKNM